MDYSGQPHGESGQKPEWPFDDPDVNRLEKRQAEFEQTILETIQQIQKDTARAARLNLAATAIFGIVFVILSIMLLRIANRPMPVVVLQPNQPVEPQALPRENESPPIAGTGGMH